MSTKTFDVVRSLDAALGAHDNLGNPRALTENKVTDPGFILKACLRVKRRQRDIVEEKETRRANGGRGIFTSGLGGPTRHMSERRTHTRSYTAASLSLQQDLTPGWRRPWRPRRQPPAAARRDTPIIAPSPMACATHKHAKMQPHTNKLRIRPEGSDWARCNPSEGGPGPAKLGEMWGWRDGQAMPRGGEGERRMRAPNAEVSGRNMAMTTRCKQSVAIA